MITVGFKHQSTFYNCVSMTDKVAMAVRAARFNPDDFYRMTWPLGASQYGHCRVLMHSADMGSLNPFVGEVGTGRQFHFNGIVFDKMFIRTPRPIATSTINEGGSNAGVLYAVDVVDERYFWQSDCTALDGFNLSLDDKEKLYESTRFLYVDPITEEETRIPWTVKQAITSLMRELATVSMPNPSDITNTGEWDLSLLDDTPFEPRDMYAKGMPIVKLIDLLLTLAAPGFVLAAFPNVDGYTPVVGGQARRYRVIEIDDGIASAKTMIDTYAKMYIGGGFAALQSGSNPPGSVVGQIINGVANHISVDVPDSVKVHFPKAAKATTFYVHNVEEDEDPKVHYATKRWHTVSSSTGRPGSATTNNRSEPALFDSTWALMDGASVTPTNWASLSGRANNVATIYFSRFKCGAGELLFAGTLPIVPYAGTQIIEWSITQTGVFTRLFGEFDCPLFGWNTQTVLTAENVFSSGSVRAMPRPGGGILIDAPGLGMTGLVLGRITAVTGAVNATYDVEAWNNAAISEEDLTPLCRNYLPIDVDHYPAAVDDKCILAITIDEELGQQIELLWVREYFTPSDCDDPVAEP